MLSIKAYEEVTTILFVVTDDTGICFEYRFGKEPPEGQTSEEYLQNCKHEAELLAQMEIDKKQLPQEITI